MSERVLFVDLENLKNVDLACVPSDARVMLFYGTTQRKLPEELVVQAQPLGTRLRWIKISGQGPNALDFHIAFYLGQEFTARPDSECAILSGDRGFDPLVRHVQTLGHACRRVVSLSEAFPAQERAGNGDPFTRLLALLRKEKVRPARLKSLLGKLRSWFPGLTDEERSGLVRRLLTESRVRESGKLLTYYLE